MLYYLITISDGFLLFFFHFCTELNMWIRLCLNAFKLLTQHFSFKKLMTLWLMMLRFGLKWILTQNINIGIVTNCDYVFIGLLYISGLLFPTGDLLVIVMFIIIFPPFLSTRILRDGWIDFRQIFRSDRKKYLEEFFHYFKMHFLSSVSCPATKR